MHKFGQTGNEPTSGGGLEIGSQYMSQSRTIHHTPPPPPILCMISLSALPCILCSTGPSLNVRAYRVSQNGACGMHLDPTWFPWHAAVLSRQSCACASPSTALDESHASLFFCLVRLPGGGGGGGGQHQHRATSARLAPVQVSQWDVQADVVVKQSFC